MGKRLLMQSDDYGISDAVSAGIRSAVRFGLIRNTGMFVNMDSSARAAEDIRGLPSMKEGETRCFICHCGYVDYELFSRTTLTLRRVKDLYAMRSEKLAEYLEKHKIERITYRDLQKI